MGMLVTACRFCPPLLLLIGLLVSSNPIGAQFSQQGSKLVGTNAREPSEQGFSVAVSGDGNTAIVGGWRDASQVGAVWIYMRSEGVWTQEGAKLVGTGAGGGASQGWSVALSADGNTAIVGGITDSDFHSLPGGGIGGANVGAAWVFTRREGVWTQQGAKLVGVGGAADFVYQGASVALSADGNTAIVGGYGDNHAVGAAWVFTRNGNVWKQQGAKLVGTGAAGKSCQGQSVALSADGNTAIVGGWCDNERVGAAWVFTRSQGVWTQQGTKLVGNDAAGNAVQGYSVSLSADGNTAVVGGYSDNQRVGAAWVYTRSGNRWTQQGAKLVGTGAAAAAAQGISVSLSANGDTTIVGAIGDDRLAGAAWVFTRKGGVWSQQGDKLVGTGATGAAAQGYAVALSADGNTAVLGGPYDVPSVDPYGTPTGTGAAWIFARGEPSEARPDLNQQGLTGSWYEAATSGQGLEIEIFPDTAPGTGIAFVGWFTYDMVAGGTERQRWYTAQGKVTTGQPSAPLTIYRNTGGNFNAPPATESQAVGSATLSFSTCSRGEWSYTFSDGSGRTGTIPLSRLTRSVTCSTTPPYLASADFALSGNWYDPAISGQGFIMEINPNSGVVFITWYTFAADGSEVGAAGQRWYTADGPFTPGMRAVSVTIYESTGGVFDTPPPAGAKTVAVGSGTLSFQSCTAATFSYDFVGGSNRGQHGFVALRRIGPVPAGCTA